jgi:hypothetical protein
MALRSYNSNGNKITGIKIVDLINGIRDPLVSSKKVEHALSNFCQVLQLMPCGAHLVGEPQNSRFQEYNDLMSIITLQGTMEVILNAMQRRHYDSMVYEWSLSALALFSQGSSYRATFLVSIGGIQQALEVVEYFPFSERLQCAGLLSLSHILANATSSSLQQAIVQGNDGNDHDAPTTRTSGIAVTVMHAPLFLFGNLVQAMERFPNSTHICKYACAAFGAAYVQNGCQLRRRSISAADAATTTNDAAAGQTQEQEDVLLFRAIQCVYHGMTMHSYDDKEATSVLRTFLRLFAGLDLANKILLQVECDLCHGGAA